MNGEKLREEEEEVGGNLLNKVSCSLYTSYFSNSERSVSWTDF